MATFPHSAEWEIRAAHSERRVAMVVGQRRSGLTHWVRRTALSSFTDSNAIVIDCASVGRSLEMLRVALKELLNLQKIPERPGDLVPLLSDAATTDAQPNAVLVANAHLAQGEAFMWLLQGLLNPVVEPSEVPFAFVIEGAFDVGSTLEQCFDTGITQSPLIVYQSSATPWQRMVEVESVLARRRKRVPVMIAPLLADLCGGDVAMLQEVVERLPEEEFLTGETFEAACTQVRRQGRSSAELRAALRAMGNAEREIAQRLARGDVILGVPPEYLPREISSLYLSGLANFDPVMCGYRIRGPLVAAIVQAELVQDVGLPTEHQHALTSFLMWQIATVELTLRATLGHQDFEHAAKNTKTMTRWGKVGVEIKRAVEHAGIKDPESLATFNRVLKEKVPEHQTLLEAVQTRIGSTESKSAFLGGLTFDELISLGKQLGAVPSETASRFEHIRSIRNDVAHFRRVSLDEAMAVSQEVRGVLQAILRGKEVVDNASRPALES